MKLNETPPNSVATAMWYIGLAAIEIERAEKVLTRSGDSGARQEAGIVLANAVDYLTNAQLRLTD